MARYRRANCKLCRREGTKLFLKGERCFSDKCANDKRQKPPGEMAKKGRRSTSEYGIQLREKQKAKRIYGILERQFRNYFKKAERHKGVTGEILLRLLELRLDNMVYRFSFAHSRKAARQLISHKHIMVNDRIVTIPSFQLSPGDKVKIKDKSRKIKCVEEAIQLHEGRGEHLRWYEVKPQEFLGTILELPSRADIPTQVTEQLIVELYSK